MFLSSEDRHVSSSGGGAAGRGKRYTKGPRLITGQRNLTSQSQSNRKNRAERGEERIQAELGDKGEAKIKH